MSNKLRQVTDAIHGTIYLSSLESEFISTPYFYRLHDIYQSSTVYMTFPSNRTKRYEHSLGTMEIASNMLFSAVSNSSIETQKKFFSELFESYKNIFDGLMNYNGQDAAYLQRASQELDTLFSYSGGLQPTPESFFKSEVRMAYRDGIMEDHALDQFQFYPISTTQDRNFSGLRDSFLYRCVLEAVRIVALFHDVGHPPYSHIIEQAMNDLYETITAKMEDKSGNGKKKNACDLTDRTKGFIESFSPFMSKESDKAYHCRMILSKSSSVKADTHERIGLALLQSAINEVMPGRIRDICNSKMTVDAKRVCVIYNVVVAELTMAILTEKSPLFNSLHQIVDGHVDADRLDYVVRDSVNSGVDWGTVPYKRLIQSCKLFNLSELFPEKKDDNGNSADQYFAIAFPKKNSDDIADMLVTRYKIFSRINYHHRCIKTGSALKACVKELTNDYLMNQDPICSDISLLWQSLTPARAGNIGMRIIQWNDSWLISVLHKALVNVQDRNEYELLRENLEEILLNKKRYYALLKRGSDQRALIEKIILAMDVKEESIARLNEKEEEKLKNAEKSEEIVIEHEDVKGIKIEELFDDEGNARDSIERLDLFSSIVKDGDLALLETLFPQPSEKLSEAFVIILDEMKSRGEIKNYQIFTNAGRSKNGIPKHEKINDEIFLYGENGYETFNENHSLIQQIEAIQNCVPVINIYFIPSNKDDVAVTSQRILNAAAKYLGKQYTIRKRELFGESI